jgi:hypothetical protein
MTKRPLSRIAVALVTAAAAASALTTPALGAASADSRPGAATPGALLSVDAVTASDVWTAGYQQPQPGTATPLAEHWDGNGWRRTKTPLPEGQPYGTLQSISVVSDDDVWAVGYASVVSGGASTTLAEHWNGKRWSVVPTAEPEGSTWSALQSVTAISADNVWAVGYFYNSGDGGSVIEHWDGSQWSLVASADPAGAYKPGLQAVTARSASDIWAVGSYFDDSGAADTLIEHWNGTKWRLVASPDEPGSPDTELHAVTAPAKGDVWATGFAFTGSTYIPVAAHWDGTSWQLMHAVVPNGSQDAYLYGVTAVGAHALWATGYYITGGAYQTLAERWNGKAWRVVSTQDVSGGSNYLFGVDAISKDSVWAAGFAFTDHDVPFVEQYDGTQWTLVPAK